MNKSKKKLKKIWEELLHPKPPFNTFVKLYTENLVDLKTNLEYWRRNSYDQEKHT